MTCLFFSGECFLTVTAFYCAEIYLHWHLVTEENLTMNHFLKRKLQLFYMIVYCSFFSSVLVFAVKEVCH